MKQIVFATMLICIGGVVSFTEFAFAKAQVVAVWKLENVESREYVALGRNEAEALGNARSQCSREVIDRWKLYCLNTPARVSFSIIPEGSYTQTCGKCGVSKEAEGEILTCSYCRPVIEKRRLNLSQCPEEARNKIENCHGELICGACP